MARVVSRRTSPPYLAIVFAFLFVLACIVAFLFYNDGDKKTRELNDAQTRLAKLAGPDDQKGIAKMLADKDQRTVVQQFAASEGELTQLITGSPCEPSVARGEADKTYDKLKSRRGLAVEAADWFDQFNAQKDANKKLEDENKALTAQLASKAQTVDKNAKEFSDQAEKLNKDLQESEKKAQDYQKEHQGQLDGAKKEWDQIRDDLNKTIAAQTKTIQEQELKIQALKTENDRLKGPKSPVDPARIKVQPVGQILTVNAGDNVCYINIGSRSRVTPGLTFYVYAKGSEIPTVFAKNSDVPTEGEGKGKLIVTSVSETLSTCRIVDQKKDDPVMAGDQIANIAFNPNRSYTFVVEGVFDVYGTGRPSTTGADQVRDLIQKYGSKVAAELDSGADYLVLGDEPPRPTKPADGQPPQVFKVYEDQMKIYDHYNALKRAAAEMHIPILNTNRFLAFVGYAPVKKD